MWIYQLYRNVPIFSFINIYDEVNFGEFVLEKISNPNIEKAIGKNEII